MKSCFPAVLLMLCGLMFAGAARAQTQAPSDDAIGQVATVQGRATVTRNNAAPVALKVNDDIFKGDVLATGADGALGVTFDDETTFNLTANARMTVDEFIYDEGGTQNAALFNVARGTAAFVASQVAKTGDMKISTPTATMGIRGTTGVVDVPEGVTAQGGTGEAKIKLYPDSDGHVGRIEVFNPQGGRLGILSAGASAFAIRGGAGRFAAVAFQIPAAEAARDRGVVQRLFQTHNLGRQMAVQRRQIRGPNFQRPNRGTQPGQRNLAPGQRNLPGQQNQRGLPGQQLQPNQRLQQPNLQRPIQPGQPLQQGLPRQIQPGQPIQQGSQPRVLPGQPSPQLQPGPRAFPGQPAPQLQPGQRALPGQPLRPGQVLPQGQPAQPGLGGRLKQNLQRFNPFAPKKPQSDAPPPAPR